jgi:cellulose synthase/poly-beta-1,6-N-acetylglucosamine synthase-like glycosyltransferase
MITTALGAVCVIIWCYLLCARGNFWIIREARPTAGREFAPKPIAIIIPARNEARLVGSAIESLLAQDYPGPVHVFLVDDESSDGTAEVARNAANLGAGPIASVSFGLDHGQLAGRGSFGPYQRASERRGVFRQNTTS